MGKKYIHVNQHVIRANKNNENNPVITIKEGKNNITAMKLRYLAKSKVSYSGNEKTALSCGARVVIETWADLIIDGVFINET